MLLSVRMQALAGGTLGLVACIVGTSLLCLRGGSKRHAFSTSLSAADSSAGARQGFGKERRSQTGGNPRSSGCATSAD